MIILKMKKIDFQKGITLTEKELRTLKDLIDKELEFQIVKIRILYIL